MDNLGNKRLSYEQDFLNRENLKADPIDQFAQWFSDADQAGVVEPNAMALATVSPDSKPSVRIVLLKGFAAKGFAFYTNYESNKAREMAENPNASLVFWWDKLQRQVRIKGKVEKLDRSYSEQYFQSRPRGSQLSAWASPQSRSMTREELERRRMETEERFKDIDPIPLPEHWGGYLLRPEKLEFWQGRANRYHDRFEYKIDENGNWQIARLAP